MRLAKLQSRRTGRQSSYRLRGYDKRKKSTVGSFYGMQNMTGSAGSYIETRGKRGIIQLEGETAQTIETADIYMDGELVENVFLADCGDRLKAFYYKDGAFTSSYVMKTSNFTTGTNTLVANGAYLYFFPEKRYINLMNTSEKGSLDVNISVETGTDSEGTLFYEAAFESCTAEGELTPEKTGYLRVIRYSRLITAGVKGERMTGYTFAAPLSEGDVITISGCRESANNGTFTVKKKAENDTWIVIEGDTPALEDGGQTLYFHRKVPDMDYVIACQNRLWGCKYGVDGSGKPVNEIYASALGDPKNWYRFEGASTDSFAATVSVDGAFTGAAVFDGRPVFFKEDSVIRVLGDYPATFSSITSNVRGIEKGSAGSAVIVNDALYYKSHSGIVRYDGGIPRNIDAALGGELYTDACAGCLGGKYYVSMKDSGGKYSLFVYDTETGTWYREDELQVIRFSRCGNELYMLAREKTGNTLYSVRGTNNGKTEGQLEWTCETGDISAEVPGQKYVSQIEIRLETESGGRITVETEYDGSGVWVCAAVKNNLQGKTLRVPVKPRKCGYFRLRLSGRGRCTIYGITVSEAYCGE